MRLYEISQEYVQFLRMVEDDQIPQDAIADTLDSIKGEFEVKADNIACIVKNLLSEAEAIKVERDVLDKRIKAKKSQADTLKQYLSSAMQAINVNKIETTRNVVSFRKSTTLHIEDEADFAERYPELCVTEIKIPKSEITKLIKSGDEFIGVELRSNQNLQIK